MVLYHKNSLQENTGKGGCNIHSIPAGSMEELVENLKESYYLHTPRLISAFLKVDRVNFVPAEYLHLAYLDRPLSIGKGQTISQPRVVAFMLELLQPEKNDKILDIGFGSGWTSALLAEITGQEGKVWGIERILPLKEFGVRNVMRMGYDNVHLIQGDGSKGWPEHAPFDKILVSASGYRVNEELKEQLKVGGRLVMPLRDREGNMVLVCKGGDSEYEQDFFPGFSFVPLEEE